VPFTPVVERVGAASIPALVDLQRRVLPEVDLLDILSSPQIFRLDDDDVLLTATINSALVGMLVGQAPPADSGAGHVWVLAVEPACQRQGVGRHLVRAFALLAEQAGTDRVWVDPVEGDREAELVKIYERLGWTDRTGWLLGRCERRQEQMWGTPASILAAVGR
jgi:ribosomal protein S18 acetylase RimI-like enzyme